MDIKAVMHTVTDKIKDVVQQLQGNHKKFSISEIATYVKENPNSTKMKQQLLGIHFHEYHLFENGFQFILETKGTTTEKPLALTVFTEGNVLYKFRSYEHKSTSAKVLSLPISALS